MSFKESEFGKYPSEWTLNRLGNVIDILTDYHSNGAYKKLKQNVTLLDNEDYAIMIRTTNFEQKAFNKKDFKYISKHAYNFLEKTKLYENDILMNKIANAGSVYKMPKFEKPVSLAMNLFLIRMKEDLINQKYAYYFMKNYERYIKTRAQGSVTKTITKENVRNLEISYPNKSEQNKIVSILDSINEKIEVNNKINKNLEEMAQAIFKQWFIDFEFPNEDGKPYKSSGGEMVESELGMIPKGWKIFKLGDFIKFIKGKKPKKIEEKFFDGCELYLTIDVLNRNSEIFANKDKIIEVNDDDILMVMDGASSGSLYYGLNGILGSTLAKISVLNTIDKSFLYYYLKLNESSIKSHLTGSAIPHTDKEFINKLCLAIPNDEMILKKADTILNNIRNHTINLNTECSKIKKVRDTLLPKLMSGEIRVPLENSEN
ncbi:hypothetical protein GNF72_04645 [Clostridium perfringens]|uniref:restriction endonuclease subunit S n=1 Tax=Clostridium perfringens TaxID=1502 RepID=UPI001CCC2EA2|nr:restriction endonuclease subunit S [Clostridium perfringens]ELC8397906.1 restriction endonuclease subunit S [Clostridium perfringens]MDU7547988.1 restriction endonuclease subunit S [Clostridium perfringens]MDZ5014553.1 hypothetical protein [Clostridium perfringens]UBK87378.1 restriction endonuclease subunit S [Clostridium perfringens]WEV20761.1 restriction endonuclease subunit S [Clostridium perfringens D]